MPLSASGNWAQQIIEDHSNDPCVLEVGAAVRDLEPDQQAELVALMWLGRGDFLVADYLLEGLDQMGSSCEG